MRFKWLLSTNVGNLPPFGISFPQTTLSQGGRVFQGSSTPKILRRNDPEKCGFRRLSLQQGRLIFRRGYFLVYPKKTKPCFKGTSMCIHTYEGGHVILGGGSTTPNWIIETHYHHLVQDWFHLYRLFSMLEMDVVYSSFLTRKILAWTGKEHLPKALRHQFSWGVSCDIRGDAHVVCCRCMSKFS